MRRRVSKVQPTSGVTVVAVDEPGRLVTLDDPAGPTTLAQGAFCRLRPPEHASPEEVASWRDSVARVARAVRVVGTPRAAAVPLASTRVDADARVGSVRQEAEAMAAEAGDADVAAMVGRLLDEVGA